MFNYIYIYDNNLDCKHDLGLSMYSNIFSLIFPTADEDVIQFGISYSIFKRNDGNWGFLPKTSNFAIVASSSTIMTNICT